MRLDRFIARKAGLSERDARMKIQAGDVQLSGVEVRQFDLEVDRFEEISDKGRILQAGLSRIYLMLHKPVGVLSATTDPVHRTALDLIDHPNKSTLHLAGRLDRSSSGLLLLTNDGRWSERLTHPAAKVPKVYLVHTRSAIPPEAIARFAEGFRFETENLTTKPACLELLGECTARVTIQEGRYHQIKRMFHRIDGIRLESLHRERIGAIELPSDLGPGEWRSLTAAEVASVSEAQLTA